MNSGTQPLPYPRLADLCVHPSDKEGRYGLINQTTRGVDIPRLILTALLKSDLDD